jgi:oxygen-dependent protoporphyrinogen oxidase
MRRVVIAGGGISGLSCAWALLGRARITLLEASPSWGGQVRSVRAGGFLFETGAESLYGTDPGLLRRLEGLGLRLLEGADLPAAVGSGGRLHPLPPGLARGAPDRLLGLFSGSLLSPWGRLRLALELLVPRGPAGKDVSIAAFLGRRIGREALERIAEPVLAGIHLARASELSLRSTYPGLASLERRHRSLALGLGRLPPPAPPRAPEGGMSELVSRLADSLDGVDRRLRCPVLGVARRPPGDPGPRWTVDLGASRLPADHLVLAMPAPAARRLLAPGLPDLAESLERIPSRSCTTVSLGFDEPAPPGLRPFFLPHGHPSGLAACLPTSRRYPGRAPARSWSARCFLRGTSPGAAGSALGAMRECLGPLPDPREVRVERWEDCRAVYGVGHDRRVADLERASPPGLHLAGAAYRGGSVVDCLRDGARAAARILQAPEQEAPDPTPVFV